MKAAIYTKYGPPDVVQIRDIEKPVPGDNEVLIRIRATSVNPLDWHFMRGEPYIVRAMCGLRKPKITRLGVDVAGQVEAVGRSVTQFKPGDEVFGACRGAFAEYGCTLESSLAPKPGNLTFEQASTVSVAGRTALQGLRDKGQVQVGKKVLVNGAAGGVGTFVVQIAKSFGADVTGVCSTRNLDMIRSIGADRAIDYTQGDFAKKGDRYDIFFDCFANHSLSAVRRVLSPRGIYIAVGGPSGPWMIGLLGRAVTGPMLSVLTSQKFVTFMAKSSKEDLRILGELMGHGQVTPVIDRCYRLSEVADAIRYLEEGHARGKVVISVA
jgi:NADPH:quinone reductase-like Zn-dependent oxidoreductase